MIHAQWRTIGAESALLRCKLTTMTSMDVICIPAMFCTLILLSHSPTHFLFTTEITQRNPYNFTMASQPITTHVKWTLKPGTESRFLEAAKVITAHINAEPKCLYFNLFQDVANPQVFKSVEMFNATIDWIRDVCLAFFRKLSARVLRFCD
jgi:hypothetical protein